MLRCDYFLKYKRLFCDLIITKYSCYILTVIITHLIFDAFSSLTENNEFITSCQTNRTFLNKKLTVRALEVTSQVRVENLANISEDVLLLYFENEGWEVEQVTPDKEEQSAVISFKMDTGKVFISRA